MRHFDEQPQMIWGRQRNVGSWSGYLVHESYLSGSVHMRIRMMRKKDDLEEPLATLRQDNCGDTKAREDIGNPI